MAGCSSYVDRSILIKQALLAENYEDALTAEGDGILIVPVETIEDALTFLDSLEPAGPEDRIAG